VIACGFVAMIGCMAGCTGMTVQLIMTLRMLHNIFNALPCPKNQLQTRNQGTHHLQSIRLQTACCRKLLQFWSSQQAANGMSKGCVTAALQVLLLVHVPSKNGDPPAACQSHP